MQLTNQNLPTFGIKLCATMPTNFINVATKYVCSERTIFVKTKQIIHGAWWCTYLHTYLLLQERDVRGAKKHMRERRISFISCLATKKKTVLHSSFFSYFMMVHSKSNDKLISSLEKDEIVFITISKQKISNPANNIIEIRQQWGNLLKSLGR